MKTNNRSAKRVLLTKLWNKKKFDVDEIKRS